MLLNLIDRGAIGLTTTHDLALTAIANQSGGRAVNVHFEDQLRDGELIFDYRMKPGPVTHGRNALALMRAVGLPVNTVKLNGSGCVLSYSRAEVNAVPKPETSPDPECCR